MTILIIRNICLVFISPPGELTSMVYFMMAIGMLCFTTNFDDMKECDASGCLLLGMRHWKFKTLHRELGMLILKLWARDLHRCTAPKRGSDKLNGLQKAGPSVASEMLVRKHHLAFAIFLHLFQLIFDDDGLVNQMLEIWVVYVEQLCHTQFQGQN
jgi:hypothetical protein